MRSKILSALIIALLLSAIISSVCFASKAEELLRDAEKATAKAMQSKRSADRDENYAKAIEIYNKLSSDKRFAGTPEAAEALYEVAKIQQTAKGKQHNPNQAYRTLNVLINTYDKPRDVLEESLTTEEVREVQKTVVSAKVLKEQISADLDKINSKKSLYKVMDFFVNVTGRIPWFSYWFAIILVTVLVKVLITPLTKAQFKSMKEMQKIAPLIKEIQEKHKGDQQTIGKKTMDLYKEHHINPFASCLPLLIQMPVLMFLYYMIQSYEFQFAKGTFLWIGSGLSHLASFPIPFKQGELVWLTAGNLAEPDLILVVLYVISMYISTKLSAVDPTQAEQQKMMSIVMPAMLAFIFAGFPSAFLLYWLVFNILQTAQQYFILRGGQRETALAEGPGDSPQGGTSQGRRRRR